MNMKIWKENILSSPKKKSLPILSFPCVQLMGINVQQLISDSELQAEGMKKISECTDTLASLSMMDLSVEAEAFGSEIYKSDNEVPTVIGRIINSETDVEGLKIPDATTGNDSGLANGQADCRTSGQAGSRTSLYIRAVERVKKEITDRPVLAGVIGPFSLAGRLMDMSEILANCYDEPEIVKKTLEKTSQFVINYILEFKKAGANGVIMAEPAAGLLSPGLAEEFSTVYAKEIVNRVKDDNFFFLYHNCGPNTHLMLNSLLDIAADAYHFGDAVKMNKVLEGMPDDVLVMGNVSPSAQFRNGTPESIYSVTTELLRECSVHDNFVVSSGCDIPPMSSWDNINSFFKAVKDFYG